MSSIRLLIKIMNFNFVSFDKNEKGKLDEEQYCQLALVNVKKGDCHHKD